jgi:hypothetical protein
MKLCPKFETFTPEANGKKYSDAGANILGLVGDKIILIQNGFKIAQLPAEVKGYYLSILNIACNFSFMLEKYYNL